MEKRFALFALATFTLGLVPLAGCQTLPDGPHPGVPHQNAMEQPSHPAFIEAACGGCHGVEPPFLSPNPHAPSFAAIANQEGLTDKTLGTWLRDAHNYPEVMDFDLEAEQVDAVADYMISLRRADYSPEQ